MNRKYVMNRIESISKNIDAFNGYLENYYLNEAFFGPSVYFYRKIIEMVRKSTDFEMLINDERFIEYIYATLASWGMHRMGPGSSKMEDYDKFKNSILSNKSIIIEISDFKLCDLNQDKKESIRGKLKYLFNNLEVMRSESKLVGNSKVIHYLLPDLCPPIDREYILRFLYGNLNSKNSPSFKKDEETELFLEIFDYFLEICKRLNLKLENYNLEKAFNTSVPKIIDNAIIGFVKSHNSKEGEKRRKGNLTKPNNFPSRYSSKNKRVSKENKYYIYENWVAEKKAVIHRSNCGNCNYGQGKGTNIHGEKNGKWHGPFKTYDETKNCALRLDDRRIRDCKVCEPWL